jgi:hypothetical protein
MTKQELAHDAADDLSSKDFVKRLSKYTFVGFDRRKMGPRMSSSFVSGMF